MYHKTLQIFLVIVVIGHYSLLSYNWTCPVQSERHFRKDVCTDPAEPHYVCVLDVSANVYVESCENDYFVARIGQKKIRKPGITNGKCRETRYQPIIFTTDEFSECMYSKSICSEEGQVIVNNGSSGDRDRTCRCDYRAGYTYIIEPRNRCECVPAEEDCSCYRTMCPPGEELSRDYECKLKGSISLTRCDAIKGQVKEDTSEIKTDSRESSNIGDSTSMSVTLSGKAAAGLIISFIFLAVLLIVLLVDLRPHVTHMTVNISKNPIINRDDTNYVYHVTEGSSMSVDCKISTRIRVKSVQMVKLSPQREMSNVVVASVISDRKRLDELSGIWRGESKHLSPTDTGEQRCILTNGLPLPFNNENTLTSKLARNEVLKYLTGFPPFSPETTNRITLRVHKIPPKSEFETQTGYYGESKTLKGAPESKRSILSVQWMKLVQRSPELKLNSLPHNGSTTYSIENITMRDSGDYICFITTKDATNDLAVYSYGFIFNVIPSESSYDKVVQHKEDNTYVQISAVDRAMEKLRKHKMVVLKGREGTGKSEMCLEIASRCKKQHQFLPVIVASKKDIKEEFDNAKVLYILDQSNDMEVDKFKELYKLLLERPMPSQAWTIIVCRSLYETEMGDELLLDCDSVLSSEEKEEILKVYMKKHNVDTATSADCTYKKKEILINQDIQVTLDQDAINKIITTEPLQGFPLMAKNFCEDRKKLHLGEKFFTNPPKEIVDKIIESRENAIREGECDAFLMFCILVYLTRRKYINMKEIKTWYSLFYQAQVMLTKVLFNEFKYLRGYLNAKLEDFDEKKIHNAASKMVGTYLKATDGVYEFIHPYMSKAVFLSSHYFATHGLGDCSIEYILEFIRSSKYQNSEEEMVLKIDREYLHLLCERLVREITIHSEKANLSKEGMKKELEKQTKVCKYIYDEWVKLGDEEFCRNLLKRIDGVFCNRNEECYNIQAWHMLHLMNHLTFNGLDPWIYSIQDLPDMAVIFGLLSACKNSYNLNEQKRITFDKLLEIFESRLTSSKEDLKKRSQSSVKLTVNDKSALKLDQYGNMLFHYLCLYNEDEACQILEKCVQCMNKRCLKECLHTKNNKGIESIHLAVALGKSKFLEKIKSVIDILMKDDKEGNIVLKQILQYVKDVHIKRKDNKDLSAFDLNKNFDPEISRSVSQGSKEDFEQVLKLFPEKWIDEDLSKSIKN